MIAEFSIEISTSLHCYAVVKWDRLNAPSFCMVPLLGCDFMKNVKQLRGSLSREVCDFLSVNCIKE
jgi:hypothetical protein